MKGMTYERCTACDRKVNGADARASHRESGCRGASTSWAFQVDVGRDAEGRRLRKRKAGFPSRAAADRAMREVLTKVDGGRYVEPSKRTLADYLVKEWLPATAPPKVRQSTYEKRRLHVESYVVPHIGGLALGNVHGANLDQLYATLARSGSASKTPLAASTIRDVHRSLHKAFEDARRWRLLDVNPCQDADPPAIAAVAGAARAAMHAWTAEELRAFLAATAAHPFGPAWHVLATTGMRRSELLGLRWRDVHLDASQIEVVQTLVRSGPRGYELRGDTKTAGSARTIALEPGTVQVFRSHRKRQLEQRVALADTYHDHGLVFPQPGGEPLNPEALSQSFRRTVDRLEVPRIRLHDLRHTHATLLLKAGVPVKVVSERLGHASPTITLTIYGHVMPGMQEEAASMLGRLLAGDEDGDDGAEVGL